MILLSIENLSNETNEQEIARLFACCGKVSSIRLTLGAPHSRYPASGLIKMQGHDATKVISTLDGYLLRGRVMQVSELSDTDDSEPPLSADSLESTPVTSDHSDDYRHQPYRVISVEKVKDPVLGTTASWCQYIIKSGKSCITGLHRGTLVEVREYAEHSAEAFNLRNSSKGRRSITWSSRSKKNDAVQN
jgi:RNA recognition motif-containing protein